MCGPPLLRALKELCSSSFIRVFQSTIEVVFFKNSRNILLLTIKENTHFFVIPEQQRSTLCLLLRGSRKEMKLFVLFTLFLLQLPPFFLLGQSPCFVIPT